MESVEIKILFFGALKQYYGESMMLTLQAGILTQDVLKMLIERKPDAFEVLESSQVAVNSTIVASDYCITQACELAVLPPFSGG
jgi:molybdopterin converting factor small subunit